MNKLHCELIEDAQSISDLVKWLEEKARQYELKYLLAHADDGVIWGQFRGENFQLVTSGDDHVFPQLAKFRLSTLQQCRAFGDKAEVMLWKVDKTWKARLINDEYLLKLKETYICEKQILWGTQPEAEKNDFTLVSDGSQGLKHAVPLPDIKDKFKEGKRPLRLTVRHYIDYDKETGVARIYLSRLVDLYADKL
ncbi:MAG TPA: TIGR03984 family CRISPR-associated protein [Planktothrix sp. UBA8407]|jgi:CRISPR-associated protein, TIGR03984 family|nr:TIGR03984 family CRISPR-associated protein [Planktothrix sp. UBA8402]HAO10005.1 TIGR03984 family CRISPR-associated protein [Planktothrix sp. UBA8407]